MKKLFAIVLTIIIVMSLVACSHKTTADDSSKVVYTDEFTITKMEHYGDIYNGWSYLMCAKSGDVGVLIRVSPAVYLQYEIGDVFVGEVRCDNKTYIIQLDGINEWFYTIETMGLKD